MATRNGLVDAELDLDAWMKKTRRRTDKFIAERDARVAAGNGAPPRRRKHAPAPGASAITFGRGKKKRTKAA